MAFDLGPIKDPEALQAIEPSITEATPGEVQGANLAATFNAFPLVAQLRQQQRFNESGPDTNLKPVVDPHTAGSDVDAMAAERGDAPTRVTLQPDEANAKAKAAGAVVTFDTPTADTTVQSVIDDHLTQQQRADVISRNGNSILSGSAARFVTSSLLSLADPINLAAMMIPVAPEAFVAEKLAAAAGVFERTAIRAGAGAVNGAVGMALLEPLNYAMSKSDYNDWSAGDALRNIFVGAALGAGGHMLLGGLFGREHLTPAEANTSMEALRAGIGQAADGRPVDVAAIPHVAEITRAADDLQTHSAPFAEGIDAFHGTPHEFSSFHTDNIGTGTGAQMEGHGLYFAADEGNARDYAAMAKNTPEVRALVDARDTALREYNAVQDAKARLGADPKTLAAQHAAASEKLDAAQAKLDAADGPQGGNVYRVKLGAKPGELLDLDKSLSAQPEVMAKLEAAGIDTNGGAMTGKELHDVLAAEYKGAHPEYGNEGAPAQFAAEQLQKAGIKGNRYIERDQQNFVMFDHKDVQITHKNGVPVAQAGADLRAQADAAAKGMAERAMLPPTDPVLDQAARVNKAAIDSAPQITGEIDKDVAEFTKIVQEEHLRLQADFASGRIMETQEMRDMMLGADHTESIGKASAGYAACLAGKALI